MPFLLLDNGQRNNRYVSRRKGSVDRRCRSARVWPRTAQHHGGIASKGGSLIRFPPRIFQRQSHLRHQYGLRPDGAVSRGRRGARTTPIQHHSQSLHGRRASAGIALRARGPAGPTRDLFAGPFGRAPRPTPVALRVFRARHLPDDPRARQRGCERRPRAVGTHGAGADRRGRSFSPWTAPPDA